MTHLFIQNVEFKRADGGKRRWKRVENEVSLQMLLSFFVCLAVVSAVKVEW